MTVLYTGAVCPNSSYIHTPLIEIDKVDDDTLLRSATNRLQEFDYLLFTSRFAVKYWMLSGGGFDIKKIVSIGEKTSEALRKAGVKNINQTLKDDSFGVIDWFSMQKKGRVLIPRSNIALPIIPEGLKSLGFDVETVTAYINRMPENPQKVNLDNIDKIIFTSPSTVDNFLKLYGAIPRYKELVTRGVVTQKRLEEYFTKNS
ncbi:MAG: uroporphyrinogen-III synthase [Bacteroidales bacterium]|nr:uroporphyrinogen-III synthase [Bacteroidales bacterium]